MSAPLPPHEHSAALSPAALHHNCLNYQSAPLPPCAYSAAYSAALGNGQRRITNTNGTVGGSISTSTGDLREILRVGDQGPMPAGASLQQRMAYIEHQLDTLAGHTILNGVVLDYGGPGRLRGGQALIQFATDSRNTNLQYALKCFVSKQAFADEVALYTDKSNPLGKCLPQVRMIVENSDGALSDAHGHPLPPCILMERGESLDQWMKRNTEDGVDMVTGLQVVSHIGERLKQLHAAGYAHRDLKPSNIMWLPRNNRWTLIDFGCAAKVGEVAPLSFSLAYSPPEVVQASRAGDRTIVATEAMDAWALGMVAVELLTNDVQLNLLNGTEEVCRRIVGELPLPWEDPQEQRHIFESLGRFKDIILALLHRDPARRPTIADFLKSVRRVFAHSTASKIE